MTHDRQTDRSTARPDSSARRSARLLARALRRRCPNCGGRGVFANYLVQRGTCPGCGLRLDRGERDFFIGAYTVNLIVAELIVFFGGLGVLVGSWPDVPWRGLMWGLMAAMILAPVLLYPYSRQVWLAIDLIFRPAEPDEYAALTTSQQAP